jgi:hypothetical protein
MDKDKFWSSKAYEYELQGFAIDWINGTDRIRNLIEQSCDGVDLDEIENEGMKEFMFMRQKILLYI